MSDTHLVKRLINGERRAFEEFLDIFGPRVQQMARRYAASSADAEDLTQEICVDLLQSVASFRGEAKLETWIYRVALHHCWRWREKQGRENSRRDENGAADIDWPSCDISSDPQRRFAQTELSQQVHHALGDLSDLHREIVELHELHGLTYAQCAQILQIPVGTVKSRLSGAFSHLRRALKPYVLDCTTENAAAPSKLAPEGGTP
ncbi:MAG: RNA polymerase sigma factor [Armatimonadetes bacterium]|nr:RNA polymerase sigma factor [Armatimonadota bacterium]